MKIFKVDQSVLFSLHFTGPAETPREIWFQQTYSEDIETLLAQLKTPGVQAYSLLKTLQSKLATR